MSSKEITLKNITEFCKSLEKGPAFLFLGQDYLRLESDKDPFLSEVLRKYGTTSTSPVQYSQIFESKAQNSGEASLAWMQELCGRLSTPNWLKTIADYAWNGVYSSAIDVIWPSVFRSDWREIHHIFEEKYKPIDPRNRSNLHCTYLFGNVSRAEEEERPPLTEIELLTHNHIAIALASRLPEIVTPFGVLVIEGYAGEKDWFSPKEDLFPIIDKFNPNQVHIFSVTDELKKNPYIVHLVNRDKLTLYSESLATYLSKGEEAGFLQLGMRPEEEEHGRRIQMGEKKITVPSNIWNQVSTTAVILDDSILIPPPPLSEEKRYYEFRDFLAESSTRPVWSGYQRGFAFHRDFETNLDKRVHERLKSKELQKEPVILHGQTGTGKTVALGALAYKIRKEKKYPVLFIERKTQTPTNSDLDSFCKWAEDCGAHSTLIVWDGMLELGQYYDVLRYLVGRGRKVVLVVSCYRLDPNRYKIDNFIEAPSILKQSEISNFNKYIKSCDPSISQLLEAPMKQLDNTFLVSLYRLLPPTRSLIRSGVHKEFGTAEKEIQRKLQKMIPEPDNTLGYALIKAGLITDETLTADKTRDIGGEEVNETEELIGLVMVPGRFGLRVPLELLLRACGKRGYLHFVKLFDEIDVFRLFEDDAGNIVIGPRHPLEAKLVSQVRLGGVRAEVAFIKQLILEVSGSYGSEAKFAVDFIKSIGSNGQDGLYFAPYYRELSETLKKLREESSVQNPRLMLQEATLLREYVKYQSHTPSDVMKIYDDAKLILTKALKILKDDRRNNKLRSMLLVELASTLGFKVTYLKDHTDKQKDIIPILKEASTYLSKARNLDPNSYYPVDVSAWITIAMLETDIFDPLVRAELMMDILNTFEISEAEDFNIGQQETFLTRKMKIASLLKNEKLSEEAFKSLLDRGSCAGYYLKAYDTIKDLPKNSELTPLQCELCQSSVDYLEKNRKSISHDSRCLYLLLHNWWKMKTGKPLFFSERQIVSFNENDWKYLLGIITDLMNINDFSTNPSLMYLKGLATFHLNHIAPALSIFRDLARESDYLIGRRRIIRSYLASTEDGHPMRFSGTVDFVHENGSKGDLYIENLRHKISFLPRDFNRLDIKKHETINEFHLAFNFIGPIADPTNYLKSKSR